MTKLQENDGRDEKPEGDGMERMRGGDEMSGGGKMSGGYEMSGMRENPEGGEEVHVPSIDAEVFLQFSLNILNCGQIDFGEGLQTAENILDNQVSLEELSRLKNLIENQIRVLEFNKSALEAYQQIHPIISRINSLVSLLLCDESIDQQCGRFYRELEVLRFLLEKVNFRISAPEGFGEGKRERILGKISEEISEDLVRRKLVVFGCANLLRLQQFRSHF